MSFETPNDALAWLDRINAEHNKYQLLRRDRLAAAALTGLRSRGVDWTAADVARLATEDADALIAALDKGQP